MQAERWRQIEELFLAAAEAEAGERALLLEKAHRDDPELAREVEAMLAVNAEEAGGEIERWLLDAPAADRPRSRAGERLGAYRLLELLGEGGMGQVYLAERADGQYRQRVAVKLLRASLWSPAWVARFRVEREILARLEHPSIARLLDGGLDGSEVPYLVLEHVEGEPITVHCDRRCLPLAERLRLFQDVCHAVHFAHQNLIVHRDLKPSNLLVNGRGEVKLLDFGIAKLVDESDAGITQTAFRLMTPEYASPEQVRGEPITTATDGYGLGLLLYQLLTGLPAQKPGGSSALALERAVCEREPERPSVAVLEGAREEAEARARARATSPKRLARELRGDLETIVRKAVAKDPRRRYPSASDLADDLERFLSRQPVVARPDTFVYRSGKFLRRHRLGALATTAVALALLAGLAIALTGMVRARRAEAGARLEAETARQVSDFLVGLFRINDPGEARGRAVTARELLDRGSEQVSGELVEQPEVQARLLRTMGQAYDALGLFDRAAALFDQDLAVRRQLHGEGHPEVAESMALLASSYGDQGEYARARDLARQALEIQRRALGPESLEVAATSSEIGMMHWNLGELDEAKPYLERALALKEKALGPDHLQLAGPLNNLAILYWRQGDLARAGSLFERALAIFEREHGHDHPSVAGNLNNLALVESAAGRLAEARRHHEQALAIQRKVLQADHPDIAESLNNLGNLLVGLDEVGAAVAALEEALAIRERALGPSHPLTGASLANLGNVLTGTGRVERSRTILLRAVEVLSTSLGPEHLNTSYALFNLAQLNRRVGDLAAAEELLERVLALRRKHLPPEHPEVLSVAKLLERVRNDRAGGLRRAP